LGAATAQLPREARLQALAVLRGEMIDALIATDIAAERAQRLLAAEGVVAQALARSESEEPRGL
jgi:hypothetical protein